MIKYESITVGEREYLRTYSDTGHKIKQCETGIVYDEAIDTLPCRYSYEETDEFVQEESEVDKEYG